MDKEIIARELKKIMKSGKVYLGIKQAKKAIERGEAKLIIVANNAPKIPKTDVPILKFDGDGFELSALCGKPFSASVVTIVSEGESKLLGMVKEG